MILSFLIIVFLLVANGWFVGSEFALVASRRTRLEVLAAEGSKRARVALEAKDDVRRNLAGAQLGVTLASLVLGFVAEATVATLIADGFEAVTGWSETVRHSVAFAIALLLVIFVHIVLGEMVPKNVAIAGPERALLAMAPVNRVIFVAARPLIAVVTWLGNGAVRLVGLRPTDEAATAHTAQELTSILEESHQEGQIDEYERALLSGALGFGARAVGSVMVPRNVVSSVPRRSSIEVIEREVARTGHSRLPVVGPGGLDDILGFVHAKDLLRLPVEARSDPLPLELVRRMLVVRADESLEQVLFAMKRLRIHLAVVQDSTSRTAGIVTLEDLLQVLVRQLFDATDGSASRVDPAGRPAIPRH